MGERFLGCRMTKSREIPQAHEFPQLAARTAVDPNEWRVGFVVRQSVCQTPVRCGDERE